MTSRCRRLTAALLWLAVALLPVRGLAAALMPAMAPAVVAAVEAPQELAPCHGATADDASMTDLHGDHAATAIGECPTCSLCTLCHAGVAQAPALSLELPVLPTTPPATAPPSALEPRAPDGLFRPPRSLLA